MLSVLFDLDGTLVDTSQGIIRGIDWTEIEMGLPVLDPQTKSLFLGPPLIESYTKYYNLPRSDAESAVKLFRMYYSRAGKYECKIYPGIRELLKLLFTNRASLFVATSKPTLFAQDILSYLCIDNYFTDVIGSNLDNSRSKKNEVIKYIISTYDCVLNSTVMIGDRKEDILAAKNCSVCSIGVTYGFGSFEEINNTQPDVIVNSVEDIYNSIREIIAFT